MVNKPRILCDSLSLLGFSAALTMAPSSGSQILPSLDLPPSLRFGASRLKDAILLKNQDFLQVTAGKNAGRPDC
jgi:hypothetical protein